MKIDIVVAHYKENIDWIDQVSHPDIRNIFVYTKGQECNAKNNKLVTHEFIPNVGREPQTYIWHLLKNFDADSVDFTFFLQGHPHPHGMNPESIIKFIEMKKNSNIHFTPNYRMSNVNDFLVNGRLNSWNGKTNPAECDVRCWCERYVKSGINLDNIPVFWGACFGVSSECLKNVDRSKMEVINNKELSTINPECTHFCERLWFYIFGMDTQPHEKPSEDLWNFWGGPHGRSHYGLIKMEEDGTISIYNNRNERHWVRRDNSIEFRDENNNLTSVLEKISDDEYAGSFLGGGNFFHRITRIL